MSLEYLVVPESKIVKKKNPEFKKARMMLGQKITGVV